MFPETNLSKFQQKPKTIVILKETGKKVALDKRSEFRSDLHEWPVEKTEAPVKVESAVGPGMGSERFEELKTKGWAKLSGEERAEYKELKAIHG